MTTERKPHKWAEIIKAWADGKPIQYKYLDWKDSEWKDNDMPLPRFDIGDLEWRVKPKNIVVKTTLGYEIDSFTGWGNLVQDTGVKPNIRFEFDPETLKLVKAEMIGNE